MRHRVQSFATCRTQSVTAVHRFAPIPPFQFATPLDASNLVSGFFGRGLTLATLGALTPAGRSGAREVPALSRVGPSARTVG
jgi:hypothetical protein